MATITSSIGTNSRTYSNIQAWEDAIPADVVSSGNSYVGECYNDSEFVEDIYIDAHTVDSTHTITLTTATGEGFRDNANAGSNPLNYNQSFGVGISGSITCSGQPFVTINNIQVKSNLYNLALNAASSITDFNLNNCLIVDHQFAGQASVISNAGGSGSTVNIRNTIFIQERSGQSGVLQVYRDSRFWNCTFVYPELHSGTKPTYAIEGLLVDPEFSNCAFFGTTNLISNVTGVFTTCYTDLGSPPTGVTQTDYSDSFVDSSYDWRLAEGSDLIDSGTTDTTNASTDIIGTARPEGSAYDVGCWEYVAEVVASSGGGGGEGKSKHMRG